MSSTGTKMVQIAVPQIEVPAQDLLKVLVVEDDDGVRETYRDHFEQEGFSADAVENPEAALKALSESSFDLVVADVRFPNGSMSGDEFILDNQALLGNAEPIVVTGYSPDLISRREELVERGVKIYRKGKETFDELTRAANEKLEQRKSNLAEKIRNYALRMKEGEWALHPAESKLIEKATVILTGWLRAMKKPDEQSLIYDGRAYSPKQVIEEIERGTEVGVEHVDMMLDLFEHSMRPKK
jgi:DNA-binding response OmpR family regulator